MTSLERENMIPKSDLEESQLAQPEHSVEKALANIGDALQNAETLLDDLEKDKMLGTAIRRFASDLADSVR